MHSMRRLLLVSQEIDRLNTVIGRAASWLVLAAILISAGNAVVRKVFEISSNAWLELQWYLFAGVVLLCGGYTLLKQAHVRIDIIYARWSRRTQIKIDIFGALLFLLPMALLSLALTWHAFAESFVSGEVSANAGGLPLWPVKALMPAGFALLALQGISETIKRVAFLRGLAPDPALAHAPSAELEMAPGHGQPADGEAR